MAEQLSDTTTAETSLSDTARITADEVEVFGERELPAGVPRISRRQVSQHAHNVYDGAFEVERLDLVSALGELVEDLRQDQQQGK